jgi:hypothetical protein
MDEIEKTKGLFETLPALLHTYGGYSYVLLALLAAAGVLFLVFGRKLALGALAGIGLLFLSGGGMVLKWSGTRAAEAARAEEEAKERARHQAFLERLRAPAGERRLFVSDFTLPTVDDARRRALEDSMRRQVPVISEILSEDLPPAFPRPTVVALQTRETPWADGVREDNFDHVIEQLNGLQVMWGIVQPDGKQAKTFLGLRKRLAVPRPGNELDAVVPLRDTTFADDDPEAAYFREGRHRLLAHVMLGMALAVYDEARAAAADRRKELFLRACAQLQAARQQLSGMRDDPVLRRNLFSPKVDQLIEWGLEQAGLAL